MKKHEIMRSGEDIKDLPLTYCQKSSIVSYGHERFVSG